MEEYLEKRQKMKFKEEIQNIIITTFFSRSEINWHFSLKGSLEKIPSTNIFCKKFQSLQYRLTHKEFPVQRLFVNNFKLSTRDPTHRRNLRIFKVSTHHSTEPTHKDFFKTSQNPQYNGLKTASKKTHWMRLQLIC